MPAYEFFCESCGQFDLLLSFNEVHHSAICPMCRARARRVYTPPGLVKTPAPLTHALDRAHKSAYKPEVMKRQPVAGESKSSALVSHLHGRPWQIGH